MVWWSLATLIGICMTIGAIVGIAAVWTLPTEDEEWW